MDFEAIARRDCRRRKWTTASLSVIVGDFRVMIRRSRHGMSIPTDFVIIPELYRYASRVCRRILFLGVISVEFGGRDRFRAAAKRIKLYRHLRLLAADKRPAGRVPA